VNTTSRPSNNPPIYKPPANYSAPIPDADTIRARLTDDVPHTYPFNLAIDILGDEQDGLHTIMPDLIRAVSELTPDQQRLIYLRYILGWNHIDIAKRDDRLRKNVTQNFSDVTDQLSSLTVPKLDIPESRREDIIRFIV
jgi:DNA-directed RNA polymerase specialized sigma24 family protein